MRGRGPVRYMEHGARAAAIITPHCSRILNHRVVLGFLASYEGLKGGKLCITAGREGVWRNGVLNRRSQSKIRRSADNADAPRSEP